MSEPTNPPTPENGTQNQSPADVDRLTPRPQFHPGDPVPNRELWILERKLGGGGFGEVWLAKHEWEDKFVAVKFCTHPESKKQLVTHEKKVVTRVMRYSGNHPNIVPLIDCNLGGETPWLIYEYVSGGTLAEAIERWQLLPFPQRLEHTLRIMSALAGALGRFHKLDPPIVHRDMKPHNVLMSGQVPRITDFGLGSAVLEARKAEITAAYSGISAKLDSRFLGLGTIRYAPPEQMFGSTPSPSDDVYALGIMAFQMLMADLKVVPGADANDEMRELNVPGELIALIIKSGAMRPERRPADATEWERELTKLLPKPAPTLPPASPPVVVSVPPPPAPPPTPSAAELRLQAIAEFQRFQQTDEDYRLEDYLAACESAAEHGLAEAQRCLAQLYFVGKGVPQDYAKAREWYEKAASQDDADSQCALGELFETGRGTAKDDARALEWYHKAAVHGHTEAKKAIQRLEEKAATALRLQAQIEYQRGEHAFHGRGGPRDLTKARTHYEKAAAMGHAEAKKALERKEFAPAPDDDLDFDLAPLEEFDFQTGEDYFHGRGVPLDYVKAREHYEYAAELGHTEAEFSLGGLYFYGHGVPIDYAKAKQWYEKAATKGHAESQASMGTLYYRGLGVSKDYAKAREWYEKAAAQGHRDGQTGLGVLYESGAGVIKNLKTAREWYEKAAAQGQANAQYYLGEFYERGTGGVKDAARALDWFRKAAAKGHDLAKKAVERLEKKPAYDSDIRLVPDDGDFDLDLAFGDSDIMLHPPKPSAKPTPPPPSDDDSNDFELTLGPSAPTQSGEDDSGSEFELTLDADSGINLGSAPLQQLDEEDIFETDFEIPPLDDEIALESDTDLISSDFDIALDDGDIDIGSEEEVVILEDEELDRATQPKKKRKKRRDPKEQYYQRGEDYYFGRGVGQSYAMARYWWQKAVDLGDTEAAYNLGVLYASGKGGSEDYLKARECWQYAADRGHTEAQYNLGYLFETGKAGEKNLPRAIDLYRQAARKGDRDAKKALRRLGHKE